MIGKREFRPRTVALILLVAGCGIAAICFGTSRLAGARPRVRSIMVRQGEFVDYLSFRGQLMAGKSITLAAPYSAGSLQILKIAPNGTQVKPGDPVVEFDTTELTQTLAQDESTLKSADAGIEQARAQARIKEEQDLTDVMKARYDVESAKLDASQSDILSKIDGAEAQLKLADVEQKLKELETDLKSDQESDAATVRGAQEKRTQAVAQVQLTETSLQHLVLKAPAAGMVTIDMNQNAGGIFSSGAPFKPGDRAWPGAALAELPNLSTLYISARVDETERGSLALGEKTSLRVDGIPDREFSGTISRISDVATIDFSGPYPYPKNFTMTIALQDRDPRLRPGMNTNIRVATDRVAGAILIPTSAVFQKSGDSVAYVLHGSKYKERLIQVTRRGEGEALISKGLQAGDYVALEDPTLPQ